MNRGNLLLGSALLWLTACGAPLVGEAQLTTDRNTYEPGSELSLQLRNESLQPLGFNLCFATLQRHEGGAWATVPRIDHEWCTAELKGLGPGEASSFRRILQDSLEAGEYRYLTDVEWNGERREVTSTSFLVVRPSSP